jgi:GDP-L-fucose synthase|tara:strand:- start:1385 stop:2326 length:942 start_codon:yes stop_codon:yes gene_type:complete
MNKCSRIYIAGHCGLVGSSIERKLLSKGFSNIIIRTRSQLDLANQEAVNKFFSEETLDIVIIAAAMVGGINANSSRPAEFIRNNLQIQTNLIDAAHRSGVSKLLFLGSSCIYPRLASQPINEGSLLSGPLEETNKAYAIAKIAGLEMCQAYRKQYGFNAICAMPTNLYGPGDNFHIEDSHVLPALIRKIHEAKISADKGVVIWGSGNPRREFLYVDDLADACLFLVEKYNDGEPINVGWGVDISIRELAELISSVIGYTGKLTFDASRPDGTPSKRLDVSKLRKIGWQAMTSLRVGVQSTYDWYLDNLKTCRS